MPTTEPQSNTSKNLEIGSTGIGAIADILSNVAPGKTELSQLSTTEQQAFMERLRNYYSQTSSSGVSNTSGQTGAASATRTDFDPAQKALLDRLTANYSQMTQPVDLRGYQAGGIQDINRSSDLQQEALKNVMAARGVSTSPVAASGAGSVESGRFGAITHFNQGLPLLQTQLNNENLGAATSFLSMVPKTTSTNTEGWNQVQGSTMNTSATTGTDHETQQNNSRGSQQSNATTTYTPPKEGLLSRVLRGVGAVVGTAAKVGI